MSNLGQMQPPNWMQPPPGGQPPMQGMPQPAPQRPMGMPPQVAQSVPMSPMQQAPPPPRPQAAPPLQPSAQQVQTGDARAQQFMQALQAQGGFRPQQAPQVQPQRPQGAGQAPNAFAQSLQAGPPPGSQPYRVPSLMGQPASAQTPNWMGQQNKPIVGQQVQPMGYPFAPPGAPPRG